MTIVFDGISNTNRLPGSQVEFSNVRAISGLPAAQQKILLIGQRTTAGTVAQLVRKRITQVDQGASFFGRGSHLAGMVAAALKANSSTELWAIAQDDNGAGTAATWTVTITGPATAPGTLALMIMGQKVPVAVLSADTATTVATAIAAAVNAAADLIVTATSAAGVVTLTCRHKGTIGNDIDIRVNHYDGEQLPAGITCAIAAGVAGATNPDLTAVWAAIGDQQYQTIVLGCNDATTLTAADTELNSRWGPVRQIEGRAYAGFSGALATCAAFGATRNGIHTTVIGGYKVPTPPWMLAAAVAGVAASSLQANPARPMTNLPLPGVIAPRDEHHFIGSERNQLLGSGISTFKILPGGEVGIERLITCYQVNTLGFPDPSYLDIMTPAVLAYYRYSWRLMISTKFARETLTEEAMKSRRDATIQLATDWQQAGLMEDLDGFTSRLVMERDATDVTQLNWLLTPNIVNPLLKDAVRIEFIL